MVLSYKRNAHDAAVAFFRFWRRVHDEEHDIWGESCTYVYRLFRQGSTANGRRIRLRARPGGYNTWPMNWEEQETAFRLKECRRRAREERVVFYA